MFERVCRFAAVVLSAAVSIPGFGAPAADRSRAIEVLDALPLRFERIGDSYFARARDYDLLLDGNRAVVARGNRRIELRFAEAASPARIAADEMLPGRTNYLIGADSSQWIRDVRGYAKVRVRSLYRGIDAVFYGSGHDVEIDLIVGRHGDPKRIAIDVGGADNIAVDGHGNARIRLANDEIVLKAPRVYQRGRSGETPVRASYRVEGGRVRFDVAKYDRSKDLVIDPVVTGSVVGVDGATAATAVVVDAQQFTYLAGQTASTGLASLGSLQPTMAGGSSDAFVAKIDSAGNVVFATYLGGSGNDVANGVAVDGSSNVFVAGSTTSTNFPLASPMQSTLSGGQSGFLTKLNSTGSAISYSTYFGGAASINALAVDSTDNAFIAGDAQNIPTVNPIQSYRGQTDAFIAKINPLGSAAIYSTYLGGGDLDSAKGVALSSAGNAWVVGSTYSPNFGVLNAFQQAGGGGEERSTDGGLTWTASNQGLTRGTSSWIQFDPANPLNAFKADFRGSYRSTDGGVHWTMILDPAANFINTLAIDPTNSQNVYFGDFIGGGVRKSTDGGTTTNAMNSGLTNKNVYSLAIDPTNALNIYAGTFNGLFKSGNGAASWGLTGLTSGFVHTILIDSTNPLNVYVGTDRDGVKKSTDGGTSFNSASTGIPFTAIRWLSMNPSNASEIWAATDSGVFRSTNGGSSWVRVTGALGNPAFNFVSFWPKSSPTVIAGGPSGTFETANSGSTWNRLAPGGTVNTFAYAPGAPNTALIGSSRTSGFLTQVSPLGSLLSSTYYGGAGSDLIADIKLDGSDNPTFAGTTGSIDLPTTSNAAQKTFGGGVTDAFIAQMGALANTLNYSSFFGGSGDDRGTGLGVGPYMALAGDTTSTDLPLMRAFESFGGAHPWFKTLDAGTTFSGRPVSGSSLVFNPISTNELYSGGALFQRSTDGGLSWMAAGSGLPSGSGSLAALRDFSRDPSGPVDLFWVVALAGIYISEDDGISWRLVYPGSGMGAVLALSYATQANGNGELFIATDAGVLRSRDNGQTWAFLTNGLTGKAYDGILVEPNSPNEIWVWDSTSIYYSSDGGNTFTPSAPPSGAKAPFRLAVDPNALNNVYLAWKGGGVFKSPDKAATWNAINTNGLTSLNINTIAVVGNPSRIVVGADDGVVQSTNGGASWTSLGLTNLNVSSLSFDPLDPNVFFARAQGRSSIFDAFFQPPASGGQLVEASYIPGSSDQQSAGKATEDASGKVKIAGTSAANDDPATGPRQQWTSPPPPPSGGSSPTTAGAVMAALGRAYGIDISGLCSADVAISNRTVSPNPIASGGSATITFTVVNNGPDDSSVVFQYDPAQTGHPAITITGATSSTKGACPVSSNVATCDVGVLAAGATATVTITGTAVTGPFQGADHANAGPSCTDPHIDNNYYNGSLTIAAPPNPHGDANGDGSVNAADVFYLISNLFAGGPAPVGSCDVNGDGVVDVRDLFYLINYLFAGGPAPH